MAGKRIRGGRLTTPVVFAVLASLLVPAALASSVTVHEQETVIPTYLAGARAQPDVLLGGESQEPRGPSIPIRCTTR